MSELLDSGHRQNFVTGAMRDLGHGKGRFDLLPWLAIPREALHNEHGAFKYEDRNWEKGIPLSSFIDSMLRHIFEYIRCKMLQQPQKEDILAAVAWNALGLLQTDEAIECGLLPRVLDDIRSGRRKECAYCGEYYGLLVEHCPGCGAKL